MKHRLWIVFCLCLFLSLAGCGETSYTWDELDQVTREDFAFGGGIRMKDLERYRIAYDPAWAEPEQIRQLQLLIKEKTGVLLPTYALDAIATEYEATPYEIVLGWCPRPETSWISLSYTTDFLQLRDMVGKRLLILESETSGSMTQSFTSMLEWIEGLSPEDTWFFQEENRIFETGAPLDTLTVLGHAITDFTIVIGSDASGDYYRDGWNAHSEPFQPSPYDTDQDLAYYLRRKLEHLSGYRLDVADTTPKKAKATIHIRSCDTKGVEDQFGITVDGAHIYLYGDGYTRTLDAIDALLSQLTPPKETRTYTVDVHPEQNTASDPLDILLVEVPPEADAPYLAARLYDIICHHMLDLVLLDGVSEDSKGELGVLLDDLYTYTHESTLPLYSLQSRLKRIYLSDRAAAARLESISTYALLQDEMTGTEYALYTLIGNPTAAQRADIQQTLAQDGRILLELADIDEQAVAGDERYAPIRLRRMTIHP